MPGRDSRGGREGVSGRGRGAGSSRAPAAGQAPVPWKIRYSERIIDEDLDDLGRAAYDVATSAIDKKLKVDPQQYGRGLGPPLVGLYKLKSSHVRVAYHIEEAAHEVWVLMLGDRQDIWKTRQGDILERLQTVKSRITREADRLRENTAKKSKGGGQRRGDGTKRQP